MVKNESKKKFLETIINSYQKYKPSQEELICAVPETIAATAFYAPINTVLETVIAGMDNETSLIARGIGILTTYFAIPYIMRGRNLAKKITHTIKESSGGKKFLTDSGFALAFGVTTKAAIYSVAGLGSLLLYSTPFDYQSLLTATGTVGLIATTTAGASFYTIDVFKELLGYKEMKRTPKWLQNKTTKVKKHIVTGAIIGSIAISGLIYSNNSKQDKEILKNNYNINPIEQIETKLEFKQKYEPSYELINKKEFEQIN